MTFKETEFPEVLKMLANYAEKIYPVNEIVKETYRLYQKVPIYIGIVSNCANHIVKEVKLKDLVPGDIVIISQKGNIYQGTVKKIKNGTVELKNVKQLQFKKIVRVKPKKITKLNLSTLDQLWPSLSFKK